MNTYPEMNDLIVSILRGTDRAHQLYAAQRIEELEKESFDLDQKLFKLKGEYVNETVINGRAFHTLRVIAGLVPSDPDSEKDPREFALTWLKAHGVDKPLMPFIDS